MSENEKYFEDLSEDMELPLLDFGPITRQQLVDYASASGDYNKIHYDELFAKKAGLKGCITHGMLTMAIVGTYIQKWAENGILKNFKIKFTGITNEKDILTIKGKVIKKYLKNGQKLIKLEFYTQTQEKVITTKGSALISFS